MVRQIAMWRVTLCLNCRDIARVAASTLAPGFCAIVPTENICFQKLLSTLIHLRISFVGSNYKKCHQNIEEKFTMQRLSIGID